MQRWITRIGGAAFLAAVAACALRSHDVRENPEIADPLVIGERLYAKHCAACHGANREGQPNWQEALPDGGMPAPPLDGSGHSWHHPDRLIFEVIERGGQATALSPDYVSRMPAYRDVLSKAEIRALVEFIKSRWPADKRAQQEWLDRMYTHPPSQRQIEQRSIDPQAQ